VVGTFSVNSSKASTRACPQLPPVGY
jgi:hypothetical protein